MLRLCPSTLKTVRPVTKILRYLDFAPRSGRKDCKPWPTLVAWQVPEHLERFIRERLPSIEQVEIVLLLRGDPSHAWSALEVSEKLGTPPESTAMRLFLLASNGVLTFESSGVPRYRYAAVDPATDALVNELAQAHDERRDALYELVGAPTRDPLRSFADAFKLKK